MKSWKPPKPQEIYDLFQNSRSRLIQSEVHLLEATIESLVRFEDEIQGRGYTPVAINFWDYKDKLADKSVFRPKHEEILSDNVRNYLINDLNNVIIHREVDISPSSTPDIVINALIPRSSQDQNRVISIVVEVKRRWHQKLKNNMQDQLLEKYMKPRDLSHGLYLVGWFESEYWDPDDSKLKSPSIKRFQSIPDLNNYLQAQAQELSKEGFFIKGKVLDISLNDIHLKRYRSL
ncbi:hypothetical protein LCGC14_0564000 [marine sediment metagenome]|uniref:Uncharacterized protein n=1 Tax=marine sediment metagenome TaxID=412755 RepID=A0A0F9S4V3_9ZZZZ